MEVRLQKLIAGTGLASRRKAEELIASGRVTINGSVVKELGTKVDPARDHVKVDGKHLSHVQPFVYLMLNKPKHVMSTLDDPGGRETVKDYLRGVSVRVFPVGRLDFDSEGLMLLTNNGDLAQALLHPRYHVPKTYLIKVKGVLTEEEIKIVEAASVASSSKVQENDGHEQEIQTTDRPRPSRGASATVAGATQYSGEGGCGAPERRPGVSAGSRCAPRPAACHRSGR